MEQASPNPSSQRGSGQHSGLVQCVSNKKSHEDHRVLYFWKDDVFLLLSSNSSVRISLKEQWSYNVSS